MKKKTIWTPLASLLLCLAICVSILPTANAISSSFFNTHTDWHFDLTKEPNRPMTQEEFIALTTAYSYWTVGVDGAAPVDRDGNRPSSWAEPYVFEAYKKGVIDPATLDYDATATLAFAMKFIVNSKGLYDINAINLYSFSGVEGLTTDEKLCLNTAVDYGILSYTPGMDVSVPLLRKDLETKYLIPGGNPAPVVTRQEKALNYRYSMAYVEDCYWDREEWIQLQDALVRNIEYFNMISLDSIYMTKDKLQEKKLLDPNAGNGYVADFIDGKHSDITHEILAYCKEQGIICLGGVLSWFDDSVFKDLLNNPSGMDQAVNELMTIVDVHNLDGLNMDIEFSGNTHRETYSALITKLSKALHAKGKLLMVSAGGNMRKTDELNSLYDYEVLRKYADLVSLITYDLHSFRLYNNGGTAGYLSNRTFTERCIRYAAMEIGAEKLLLGLASNGVCYNTTDHTAYNINYSEIERLMAVHGATPKMEDSVADDYYFSYVENGKNYLVYFESAAGTNRRIENVTAYGLGGTAFFHLQSENEEFFRAAAKKQTHLPFEDIDPSLWYGKGIEFAYDHHLFNGVSDSKFAPDGDMTRAMLVTVLWRYAGMPEEGNNGFTDVAEGTWYTQAVSWAAANGIVNGVGKNRFDPDGKITREQMAAILFRYASQNGANVGNRADLGSFPDANKVSGYAKDALQWAVAEGLISGVKAGSTTYLRPQGNATRAQVATILMRFVEGTAREE